VFLALPSRNISSRSGNRQQGAALVLALMVVVLVVLLATTLGNDFLVTLKRVENQLHSQQAFAYMRGAEGIARQQLQLDFADDEINGSKDHRSEGFNQRVEFPLEQGAIAGTLCDLQGRFNLNNLPGEATAPARYTVDQEMFIRLLQSLELSSPIDQPQAEEITNAVVDWIDSNTQTRPNGGAEDSYYSGLELPMRTGNQTLHSASELRWVKGINAEIYAALEPHVTALPEVVLLNVNSADATVLRVINSSGDLSPLPEGESIVEDRDGDFTDNPAAAKAGFDNVAAFVSAYPTAATLASYLAVSSHYFLLQTEAVFMDRQYQLFSVLHRANDGKVTTLARGPDGFGRCPVEE